MTMKKQSRKSFIKTAGAQMALLTLGLKGLAALNFDGIYHKKNDNNPGYFISLTQSINPDLITKTINFIT